MNCEVCGVELEGKKAGAKYCSPKCRKIAFNKRSIGTDNPQKGTDKFTIEERIIPELYFEYYILTKANGMGRLEDEKSPIRKAKYWYDVPISAIPVIKKDWPKMPDYMNGRQYFLWWKNEFKEKETGPVLVSP